MGWWKIKDVESGAIDVDAQTAHPNVANAIPGKDDPGCLYGGDGPVDVMAEALSRIRDLYEKEWGRPAKRDELLACFNFCASDWPD